MKYYIYELGDKGKMVNVEGHQDEVHAKQRFSERREARRGACIVFADGTKIPSERAVKLETAMEKKEKADQARADKAELKAKAAAKKQKPKAVAAPKAKTK